MDTLVFDLERPRRASETGRLGTASHFPFKQFERRFQKVNQRKSGRNHVFLPRYVERAQKVFRKKRAVHQRVLERGRKSRQHGRTNFGKPLMRMTVFLLRPKLFFRIRREFENPLHSDDQFLERNIPLLFLQCRDPTEPIPIHGIQQR